VMDYAQWVLLCICSTHYDDGSPHCKSWQKSMRLHI
jgi:hypothetical protein